MSDVDGDDDGDAAILITAPRTTTTTPPPVLVVVDFDSVTMYAEIVAVFVLIMTGTYLYTLRDVLPAVAPFLVLVYAIAIFAADVYQRNAWARVLRKTDDPPVQRPRTLGAAMVWVAWLVYGIVFRDVAPLLPDSVAYVQSALAVALVLATYVRRDLVEKLTWSTAALLVAVLLLFVPHADTVTHDMNALLLFAKTFVFYVLYVLTEISQLLHDADARRRLHEAPSSAQKMQRSVANAQIKVLQSAWVLLATKYFVLGAIAQLLPLYVAISTTKTKRAPPGAPVELREIRVEERGARGSDTPPRRHQGNRTPPLPRADEVRRSARQQHARSPAPASKRPAHMSPARIAGVDKRALPAGVHAVRPSRLPTQHARRPPPQAAAVFTGVNQLSDQELANVLQRR